MKQPRIVGGAFVFEGSVCQQWFSVAGQCFDIVGFLLIAFEWRHMFLRERERRIYELQHDLERSRAEYAGQTWNDPRAADHTMWREFQKLFLKEWRMRGRFFYTGVVFVLLGFVLQVMGSWPRGVFGIKSC